ncbi:MAPEG family protein [Trichothermofontia sp.]
MSPWPALVTGLALLMYLVITINVGRARFQYKVPPPQMTGDPDFERVVRVQQNTLEQMVFFLPALWLFCLYVDPRWGAGLGAVWILGRILYAIGYYQAADKRGPGFAIGSLSSMALLLGALIGILRQLILPALIS